MLVEFFKSRTDTFRTRSGDRDRQTDAARVAKVMEAIDEALSSSQAERGGLDRRLNDVLARAAISGGNGDDEYLTRDTAAIDRLKAFDVEIKGAQQRLASLDHNIAQFEALKRDVASRFPEWSAMPKDSR